MTPQPPALDPLLVWACITAVLAVGAFLWFVLLHGYDEYEPDYLSQASAAVTVPSSADGGGIPSVPNGGDSGASFKRKAVKGWNRTDCHLQARRARVQQIQKGGSQ